MHQALFVPTIYNMALFSRPLTESYYMIGTANHIAIKSASSTRMELKNRDGNQSYILTSTTDGGGRYLNIGNFRCTAGNYTLTYDEGQAGVSFNYSRSESVMDYMDVKAIEDALSVVGVERCESLDSKRTPIDEQIRSRINGKELWRWCVIGCLVMLMVEILLTRIPQNKRT